jgi:hypothetical protein
MVINSNTRVKGEIQDSLIFKSDDKTLKHLDKLKENNKEIQNIICWLEEFNISSYTKDLYSNVKKKRETCDNISVINKFKEGIDFLFR